MITYSYGGFVLHDGVTYFVNGIDLSAPPVNTTTVQVARFPGLKKTGEVVGERTFSLTISVLSPDGTRAGLRRVLDPLYKALNRRQQPIVLQDDGRYMIGDCVQIQAQIKDVAFVVLQVNFECVQPFAWSPTTQTATLAGTMSGIASPFSSSIQIAGGGTVFAVPVITITNTGTVAITQLGVTNTTQNSGFTTISLTLNQWDYATIYCDPAAANNMGWTISKNGVTGTLYDFSGIFPNQDPDTDLWTITATAASAPTIQAVWSWQSRYLA